MKGRLYNILMCFFLKSMRVKLPITASLVIYRIKYILSPTLCDKREFKLTLMSNTIYNLELI